jgi:hypothetical protein
MVVSGGSIAQWLTFGIENEGVFYTFVYAAAWPKPVGAGAALSAVGS